MASLCDLDAGHIAPRTQLQRGSSLRLVSQYKHLGIMQAATGQLDRELSLYASARPRPPAFCCPRAASPKLSFQCRAGWAPCGLVPRRSAFALLVVDGCSARSSSLGSPAAFITPTLPSLFSTSRRRLASGQPRTRSSASLLRSVPLEWKLVFMRFALGPRRASGFLTALSRSKGGVAVTLPASAARRSGRYVGAVHGRLGRFAQASQAAGHPAASCGCCRHAPVPGVGSRGCRC